jgi:cytochrome c biogenesis protein CcmG/thiol:disulfide interchange protein DsbE
VNLHRQHKGYDPRRVRLRRRVEECALRFFAVAAALLFATSLMPAPLRAAPPTHSLLHKQAPSFVRADLDGKQIDLSTYRGKVLLLNFWATWCAPCQLELPRFNAWQEKYGSDGLQVIAVSMDDDPAPVRATDRKLQLNFPVIMGDAKLGTQYGGVLGLPITYLIGRDGTIRARLKGAANLQGMEKRIRKLLATR